MPDQEHDAIVEVSSEAARVQALSAKARHWIETHVTLEQVDSFYRARQHDRAS
jgi:hypothetical protein